MGATINGRVDLIELLVGGGAVLELKNNVIVFYKLYFYTKA
jgi:hypothetical protein